MVTVIVRSGNSQDTCDRKFIPEGTAGDYLRRLQAEGHCVWVEQYPERCFWLNGEEVGPATLILQDGATLEVSLRRGSCPRAGRQEPSYRGRLLLF